MLGSASANEDVQLEMQPASATNPTGGFIHGISRSGNCPPDRATNPHAGAGAGPAGSGNCPPDRATNLLPTTCGELLGSGNCPPDRATNPSTVIPTGAASSGNCPPDRATNLKSSKSLILLQKTVEQFQQFLETTRVSANRGLQFFLHGFGSLRPRAHHRMPNFGTQFFLATEVPSAVVLQLSAHVGCSLSL